MENFKPFKGRTVSEGQLVDAYYRTDGIVALRDVDTRQIVGTCTSVTLKDAKFSNGSDMHVKGTITSYELQNPIKLDYDLMRSMMFKNHAIEHVKYIKLAFQHQITVE